jgi:excisionase family DNA binding protein
VVARGRVYDRLQQHAEANRAYQVPPRPLARLRHPQARRPPAQTCNRPSPCGRSPSVTSETRPPLTQIPQSGQLLYTLAEAAAALLIRRTKLDELVGADEIESIHIGRSRKIPADALRTFIDRLRIPNQRKEDS